MARTETVLRVFISCPSDVKEEVESAQRVIEELNGSALRATGLRLEMVTWVTDVAPGVSNDVQSVINEQIGDDYDIFIGILWARFGRPTPRAGSGTEEEFERAYARVRSEPDSLRLMVYFKTAAIRPDGIDPDQIKQVQRFKSQLEEKGTLYCEFETRDSFEVFLRSHLTKQVQGWGREWGKGASAPRPAEPSISSELIHSERQSEEGALDLIESGIENFTIAVDSTLRVARLLGDSTTRMEEKTTQLNALKGSQAGTNAKELKRIINAAAVDLEQFAKGLGDEAKILSGSLISGLDAFSRVLTYRDCFSAEDLTSLTTFGESLNAMSEILLSARGKNEEMKETIAQWPRMTTLLNRAKRSAVEALVQYDGVLREALQLSRDAKQNYHDLFIDISRLDPTRLPSL